jgi:hypothetical protein
MPYENSENENHAKGVAYVRGDKALEVLEQIDPEAYNHSELFFKQDAADVYAYYGESVYKVTITVDRV